MPLKHLTIHRRPDKTGGIYHVRGTFGGQRIRQTLGTSSKREAEQRANEIETSLLDGKHHRVLRHLPGRGVIPTIRETIRAYRKSPKASIRETTEYMCNRLEQRIGHFHTRSFRHAQWQEYIDAFHIGNSPGTIRRDGKALNAILAYGTKIGHCDPISLDLPPENPPSLLWMHDEEFDALAPYLTTEMARVVTFMRYTGARPVEVRRLTVADFEPGFITLWTYKGKGTRNERRIPLHPRAAETFAVTPFCDPDAPLFRRDTGLPWTKRAMSGAFCECRAEAPIRQELGLYSIRHAFGTTLGRKGTPIKTIATLMGHDNIKTTMQYVKSTSQDEASAILSI